MYFISKKIIWLTIVTFCCWLVAENFVIKKKRNSTNAMNALRQECCEESAQLLKLFPLLFRLFADVQEIEMTQIYEFLACNKDSFFAHADQAQLQNCLSKIQSFKEQIVAMQTHVRNYLNFLYTLKSKNIQQIVEKKTV